MLAFAGEWDRGVEFVERAIDLNPHHPGWMHNVLATNHYRKGEFGKALVQAKRSNLPQYVWTPLHIAGAAGQLGLAADARAALDGIRKNHPAYLDPDKVRALWSMWLWDADLVERFVEGFVKALALVDRPADAARPSSAVSPAKSPASDRLASIAVMPFADLSPAKDQEWFCDGIAEEILNALTPLKNLRVAARASAFSLRGKSDDLKTIGEKLNVTTVLGGSVRRAGDRVRITVQLSEVQSGVSALVRTLRSRARKTSSTCRTRSPKAVADRLKVTLADGPLDRLARLVEQGTTDVEAYQLYLQGRALLNRRGASIRPALEAVHTRRRARSELLAGLGRHRRRAHRARRTSALCLPPNRSRWRSTAARRALELDPSSAAAHTALACATLLFENNRDLAGQEFERALQLNPQYVQGRSWYALFYLQWARGDFERGVAEARRTLESDPLSAYATMILAACLFTAGRRDEAIDVGRLAVERDPESFIARWMLGHAQIEAERYEEAIATLEDAAAMSRRHPFAVTTMAVAFGRCGKPEAAETLLRELTERAEHSYVPANQLIAPAEAVGRRDLAIQYAERAWAEREPPFILFARYFPEWRSIRSDPRFQAILREMDAPIEDP